MEVCNVEDDEVGGRLKSPASLTSVVVSVVALTLGCGGNQSVELVRAEPATSDDPRALARFDGSGPVVDAEVEPKTSGALQDSRAEVRAYWVPEPVYGGQVYVTEATPEVGSTDLGGKTPLLLVHGLGTSAGRDFLKVLPPLARKRRVIVVDLPGFGNSTKENKPYAPDGQAAVLDHVLRRLGHTKVDVVGHSMGGAISLAFAARYQDRVRRLVVVDAAGILHRESYVLGHVDRLGALASGRIPGAPPLAMPFILVGELARKLEPRGVNLVENDEFRTHALSGDPLSISAFSLMMHDFSGAVAALRVPTMLLWGDRDVVAPVRTGKALQSRLRAPLHLLPSGHDPLDEAPEQVVRFLEAHFDQPLVVEPPRDGVDGAVAADATYENCDGLVLSGSFRRLALKNGRNVTLRDVFAEELLLADVDGVLEAVEVKRGARISDARLLVTGGSMTGNPPLIVEDSDLNLAGVVLRSGGESLLVAKDESRLLFSISEGATSLLSASALHGVLRLEDAHWPERGELASTRLVP
jgi:pimeloyl-ACP methyl ester carboxylesterase